MKRYWFLGTTLCLAALVFFVIANPKKSIPITTSTPTFTIASSSAVASPSANPNPQLSVGVPILMYHYVGNNPNPADRQRDILSISPNKLDAQFNWLAQNGYTPITLDTLYGLLGKKETLNKPIVLTFDDGYVDFFINAFPLLQKYHFHAVSFIITGLANTSYYMSWDQIKQIQSSGLVSFQAHTVTHPSLPTLSYSDKLYQLVTSKKTLEQQLGTTVNFAAYPYGSSDPDTWRAALASGFVGGVGTWAGKATGPGINMPRIRIVGSITLPEFAAKVSQ